MRTVWHVYINGEDDRIDLCGYPEFDSLPFDDNFRDMKLFATKGGAKKYVFSLAKKIGKKLSGGDVVEYPLYEACDGGEFRQGILFYDSRSDKKEVYKSIWIKAVRREVGK